MHKRDRFLLLQNNHQTHQHPQYTHSLTTVPLSILSNTQPVKSAKMRFFTFAATTIALVSAAPVENSADGEGSKPATYGQVGQSSPVSGPNGGAGSTGGPSGGFSGSVGFGGGSSSGGGQGGWSQGGWPQGGSGGGFQSGGGSFQSGGGSFGGSGSSEQPRPLCSGLGQPQCCGSNVLGLASLDCKPGESNALVIR